MKRHFLLSVALLFCAIIGASRAHAQTQWNTNLLQNTIPTYNSQFTGWEKTTNGGSGWKVENNCFCSSYNECVLSQTITLADYGFTADNLSGKELYASVQYEIPRKSTSQSGICIAAVVCLDGSGVALDTLYLLNMTGYTNVEVASTVKDSLFALPAGTAQLRYKLHGCDQVRWNGQYGPRFTDMKMMLIDRSIIYTASIDPAIGDSITLSKTDTHFGDTIEVSATYPEYSILYLILNGNRRVDANRFACTGNVVVSAHLRYPHAITLSAQNATLTASETAALAGDIITLTHTMEQGYVFVRYSATPNVQWLDEARFIMPDTEVTISIEMLPIHSVPFFEGFEVGNQQDSMAIGWLQQDEKGNEGWRANSAQTNYNRTPYAGSWNATLYRNNIDWLFTYIRLEAGKQYRISMMARQDGNITSNANIRACLGNMATKDAMTTTILAQTDLTNGDYQLLTDTFRVATTGVYVLGIRGDIQWATHLSLDNIRIEENQLHTITILSGEHGSLSANKTTAYAGDTIALTATIDEGYGLNKFLFTPSVRHIDNTRFIMPDEDVAVGFSVLPIAAVPFFEGFENGNKQDSVVQGWIQKSESGDQLWCANSTKTDRNRTPYAGSWNATLYYSNTNWLFTYIRLEAGKQYRISMMARQDQSNTSYANIRACLGKVALKDSMTTTILAQTGITNGEYQTLTDTFRVAESGVYALGIRGYISGSPFYLSLDNIRIEENQPHTITFLPSEYGSLSANKTTAYAGDTITLIPNIDERYMLDQLLCTPAVRRIGNTRFIMPDEDVAVGFSVLPVAAVPFFEGFENGNKQDSVIQGWIQQSENGDLVWCANSTYTYYNCTPYAGSWNATLRYNNTNWLFTYIRLEAGKQYRISMMARQDQSNTLYANIRACLGKAATGDSMTTTILAQTSLTNGDYQLLTDTFRVAESGIYALGIRGYINNTPYYLSLDNIRVDENKPRTITFLSGEHGSLSANKATAYAGDTVTLIPDMEEGYTLCRLLTTPAVRIIDNTHFIMPDDDVTIGFEAIQFVSVPFLRALRTATRKTA